MKHFLKLSHGADVMPLLLAVKRQAELWDSFPLRTSFEDSPHVQAHDIVLRAQDPDAHTLNQAYEKLECIDLMPSQRLPEANPLIYGLMARVGGQRLGRVIITMLEPGKVILPHEDTGPNAEYYDRFHVVLQGMPGSIFRIGDEKVMMQSGDIWWINNTVDHECINNSADDRIHMIIDIRTRQ